MMWALDKTILDIGPLQALLLVGADARRRVDLTTHVIESDHVLTKRDDKRLICLDLTALRYFLPVYYLALLPMPQFLRRTHSTQKILSLLCIFI